MTERGTIDVADTGQRGVGEKVWSFDLSEDCSIRMVLTGHVTKEALERLKEYIDISIKTAPNALERLAKALDVPVTALIEDVPGE